MSLTHVEAALNNAQDISDIDIGIQLELETEDQCPDEWHNITIDSNVDNAFSQLSEEELERAASDASVEVSEGTNKTYRRYVISCKVKQFHLRLAGSCVNLMSGS